MSDLSVELEILQTLNGPLACLDEAGRGALAGPVSVGCCLLPQTITEKDTGGWEAEDSKALSAKRRKTMLEVAETKFVLAYGETNAGDIDRYGIVSALGRAAKKALEKAEKDFGSPIGGILLDGPHDYVTSWLDVKIPVVCRAKADRDCKGVATASLKAKCLRDKHMEDLDDDYPWWGFKQHKGYGTAGHLCALQGWGASSEHRMSWKWTDQSIWPSISRINQVPEAGDTWTQTELF